MNVDRQVKDLGRRLRGSAGVTAVEYALVLGLVVVGILAALSGFDEHAEDEITARGNRVGNPEQLRATDTVPPGPVSSTTTTTAPVTTTTWASPSTTTTTTTITLPPTTTSTTIPTSTSGPVSSTTTTTTSPSSSPVLHIQPLSGNGARVNSFWTATVLVTVTNQHGNPLSGVLIQGGWSESAAHVADCVTGVSGSCTVSQTDLQYNGSNSVGSTTYVVLSITADPGIVIPAGTPDATVDFYTVNRP